MNFRRTNRSNFVCVCFWCQKSCTWYQKPVPSSGTSFILVPENWYQNKTGTRTWHRFLVPVARFLAPETNVADDAGEIAAVPVSVTYVMGMSAADAC